MCIRDRAMGHLITLAMPEAYGYANYKAEELPICPNPFQLIVRQVRKDKEYHEDPVALKQLKAIGSCFNQADRIIVATDAGREGCLLYTSVCDDLSRRGNTDDDIHVACPAYVSTVCHTRCLHIGSEDQYRGALASVIYELITAHE